MRRFLVGAVALPVMLVVAGCSSGFGSGGDDAAKKPRPAAKAKASASASTVKAAAYGKLPEACAVLSKKTLEDLVPKGVKSGKPINDGEPDVSGDCRWTSLDNNGVKGSQYRWLSVSLLLLESDASRGAGEKRAHEQYKKKVAEAQTVEGAKRLKSEPVSGTGDEATVVRYEVKKKEGTSKQQTLVARVENVVLTLDFNGAGLAGEEAPDADDLVKGATAAAKEVVAAVSTANDEGEGAGTGAGTSAGSSPSPSKSTAKPDSDSDSKPDSDSGPDSEGSKTSRKR